MNARRLLVVLPLIGLSEWPMQFDAMVTGYRAGWQEITSGPDCVVTKTRDEVPPGRTVRILHTCGHWECVEVWAEMDYRPGEKLARSRTCIDAARMWGSPPDPPVESEPAGWPNGGGL